MTSCTQAVECQHCYCMVESDAWMVNRVRYRCCQCHASFGLTFVDGLSWQERTLLADREFMHKTIQAQHAMDSGVDKGIRYADLKRLLGDEVPE